MSLRIRSSRSRLSALLLLGLPATQVHLAAPPTIDDIQTMQMTLEQQGLMAFNAAVNANNWQAPVIPSRWYLDHIAAAEQRPLGEAARELGSALLSAIGYGSAISVSALGRTPAAPPTRTVGVNHHYAGGTTPARTRRGPRG
jgi:hypothetical protein